MAGREFGSLHQQENFSIRGKSERNLVIALSQQSAFTDIHPLLTSQVFFSFLTNATFLETLINLKYKHLFCKFNKFSTAFLFQ
jgi:hypothetical protein